MERWKEKQTEEIRKLVDSYVEHVKQTRKVTPDARWMRWIRDYICRRFQNLDSMPWVEALTYLDLSDEAKRLAFSNKGAMAMVHLKRIRNYARKTYSIIGDDGQRRNEKWN